MEIDEVRETEERMTAGRQAAAKRIGNRGTPQLPRERTHPLVLAALTVSVIAFAIAGWWGYSQRENAPNTVAMTEAIRVPGGELRVVSMRPEIMASMSMPGMSMPDMAPEGYSRFVVDVEVRGTSTSGVAYDPRLVRLEVPGQPPVPPVRAVNPSTEVRRGETLAVSLLFQAPEAADSLALTYEGARQRVALRGDIGGGHGHVAAGPAPDHTVAMAKSRYSQPRLAARAGSTVRWVNEEPSLSHTVTFEAGPTGSDILGPGDTFQITFDEPGTYAYICTIHPSMRGEVVVTPRG